MGRLKYKEEFNHYGTQDRAMHKGTKHDQCARCLNAETYGAMQNHAIIAKRICKK